VELDGFRERVVIKRLLKVFDRFNIAATWALVGHMFYEECEKCGICPVEAWKGRYPCFERIYGTNDPLWYGNDIVDILRDTLPKHEIAFHGYTHRLFNEKELSKKDVGIEIEEWLRLAEKKKIIPSTVIFPRGIIGFLPVFKDKGFICYRGNDLTPRALLIPYFGKVLKWLDKRLKLFSPIVYDIETEPDSLVNLPASRRLFGLHRNVSSLLDRAQLGRIKVQSMIKGVEKAAREKKVIHIRTHPYEFRTENDFAELEMLLACVADEIKKGGIQSVTMGGLAQLVLQTGKSI